MENKAIVYTKNHCKYCQVLKNFLDDRGVPYEARNIDEDGTYMLEFEKYGYQSVPLTIMGEHQIVGFNLGQLNQMVAEL